MATHTWRLLGATAAIGALILAGCSSSTDYAAADAAGDSAASSSSDSGSDTGADSDEKITLTVTDWGNFGLVDLIPEYEALHPNITIQETAGDYNTNHQNLQQFLVAGSGAPDISAIDEGFIISFAAQHDKFYDFGADPDATALKDAYLPWKWAEATNDGHTIGLGTDVGGLAMCYRPDLFEAAGLPTDRDEVSALWPTWDDYIAVGKKYVDATGKKFVDDAVTILNPVLGQQEVGYFDSDDELQMEGGPKAAWDIATRMITEGLSADLPQANRTGWAGGFKNGSFATLACPAWMLGQIKTNMEGAEGTWDVADMPGGGGNWGGSFWAVPAQGDHVDEAVAFVKWLIAPEQQIAVFKEAGNLPSQPALWDDPAIKDYVNPDMNNAPTGAIFTKSAGLLPDPPQFYGTKNGAVRAAVEAVLTAVEQGQLTVQEGWDRALTEAAKAAEG